MIHSELQQPKRFRVNQLHARQFSQYTRIIASLPPSKQFQAKTPNPNPINRINSIVKFPNTISISHYQNKLLAKNKISEGFQFAVNYFFLQNKCSLLTYVAHIDCIKVILIFNIAFINFMVFSL